jgi:C-terminal processing protease CtpA/Prc
VIDSEVDFFGFIKKEHFCILTNYRSIMKGKVFLLLSLLVSLTGIGQNFTLQQYHEDLNFFWQNFQDNYCYFNKKNIDWNSLKPFYEHQVDTVTSRSGFVSVLEAALFELYDHHCSLHTNTPHSRRLVPTGTDIWAKYQDGKPVVVEVRKNFAPEKLGIQAGDEVIAINDLPVEEAIFPFLGHNQEDEAKSFALRLALAGDHIKRRKITLKRDSRTKDYFPDQEGMMLENITYPAMVQSRSFGKIGYIKVNNFLFDNELIPKFDSVLNSLMTTQALIIDLRETPSGGNTSVARAILGRFITTDRFYQKHESWGEEKQTGIKRSWEEIVSPRDKPYLKPLVILVDHWTGSVSEGITVGFDGMKRATIIGTEMARLNGAVETFRLPQTGIGVNMTTERLYHINGLPREQFVPSILVNVKDQSAAKDPILQAALNYLNKRIK